MIFFMTGNFTKNINMYFSKLCAPLGLMPTAIQPSHKKLQLFCLRAFVVDNNLARGPNCECVAESCR